MQQVGRCWRAGRDQPGEEVEHYCKSVVPDDQLARAGYDARIVLIRGIDIRQSPPTDYRPLIARPRRDCRVTAQAKERMTSSSRTAL